jgi:ketosteroid isomerase-like protein
MLKQAALNIIIFLLVACNVEASNLINEQMVRDLVDNFQLAVKSKDVNSVISYFSDDAIIEMTLALPGGQQKSTLNKTEYKALLESTWKHSEEYTYEVTDLNIRINSDRTVATVLDTIIESMKFMGQRMTTKTKEEIEIKIINEKLLITSVVGVATI